MAFKNPDFETDVQCATWLMHRLSSDPAALRAMMGGAGYRTIMSTLEQEARANGWPRSVVDRAIHRLAVN